MYSNSKSPPNHGNNKGNPFAGIGNNFSMSPMEQARTSHEDNRMSNKKKASNLKSSESMTEQKVRVKIL
jgi:hypothetical protein